MLKKLLKQMDELIRNKADADALDQIRGVIAGMGGKSTQNAIPPPLMSTKDLNLLKELDRKVAQLEESLNKMNSRSAGSDQLANFTDRLEAIEKALRTKADQDDLDSLLAMLRKAKADLGET